MSSGILAVALTYAHAPGLPGFPYQSPTAQTGSHIAPAPDTRVDINSASLDQLRNVPRMTHTWAARIIHHRPYRAKNDLADHGVVTSQAYDRIKDYINRASRKTPTL